MKITQKNEAGEDVEVEVKTQAEVDAEKAALEAAHKNELGEKDKALSEIATQKADLEKKIKDAELAGMKEDHPNFKILKEALSKKDSEIKEIKDALNTDKSQRIKDEMEAKIKIASRGNTDLEKKIQYHLEKTLPGLPENTVEERKTKLEAAIKLASDHSTDGPGMFDMGAGANGYGGGQGHADNGGTEFSAKEKALGAKLGLTPEDYKKYGSRVSKR